ncbi:hypothetical protein [Pelagerythrobacter marensis]|uniref:Uncharacterized protein n=1 Tax=Pelagerythrobacter marensis TaxID=543877 RepID=A0A0G3X6R8_9SPHN|nr:hypothetical protein [Pelagerythrobacter marensis]AKM07245.1 hypothetical protein AM2010_1171 [Pelagerythrobacter marensis]
MGAVLSIVMLAGFALLVGAFVLWRKGGSVKQAVLMVVLALVCFANIAIWTVPTSDGDAPLDRIEQDAAE